MPTNFSSGVVLLQKVTLKKIAFSRQLRKAMTEAETILWKHLRRKSIDGIRIRRQQIIAGFIADFFCHAAKLVIEVDGAIHTTLKQKKIDKHRTKVFADRGLLEVRFSNEEVISNIDHVLGAIHKIVALRVKDGERQTPPVPCGPPPLTGRTKQ